jgi:hypothetical protein
VECAVVVAAAEKILDGKLAFLAGGKREALKLSFAPPHIIVESVADVDVAVEDRSLDIAAQALVAEHLEEALAFVGLAYAVEGHVHVVAFEAHFAGCR